MKLLGRDYRRFEIEFCDANRESIEHHASHTDTQALFDWVCNSPKLKLRIGEHRDRNDATLLQLLTSPDTREEINVSGSGLFYDDIAELVVVNWTQAIQTVLSGHARYGRETNIYNLRDLASTLSYPGFWKFLARHPRMTWEEGWRSLSRRRFCRSLQRLVPALREQDLEPGGAGVRAQALSPEGELVQDFRLVAGPRALHVVNAPSPAATAALAIGRTVIEKIPVD
jgi:hypothetical protein